MYRSLFEISETAHLFVFGRVRYSAISQTTGGAMHYLEMNSRFFRACHTHGLAMPINQWRHNDWDTFESMWCMGGEL